jgi:hypothetical protein
MTAITPTRSRSRRGGRPATRRVRPKAPGARLASNGPLQYLRAICLALPEATEKTAWGEPTFRVRDKMFAMYTDNHHRDGRVALWCKAPEGAQEILVGAAPTRFFVPPYVGHKGWIGVRLDIEVDWNEVAEHVKESYRMTAPRQLVRLLDLEGA